jgi:hypothetical protein
MVLEPGRHEEALSCSLEICNLDEITPYEAISYTWGQPEHTSSVFLDGHQVGITANLDKVLHCVRLLDQERRV